MDIYPRIRLVNILFIPEIQNNLLSISKLIEFSRIKVMFDENGCFLHDLTSRKDIAYGRRLNGLYKLNLEVKKKQEERNEVQTSVANVVKKTQC